MSFHCPVFSRIRTESTILSLHGRIRISENPYSCAFYAVVVSQHSYLLRINPIHATGIFLRLLTISENLWFFYVKRLVSGNRLTFSPASRRHICIHQTQIISMYITIAYVKCTWCFTWVNNVEHSKIWNSKLTIKPVKELLQVDASYFEDSYFFSDYNCVIDRVIFKYYCQRWEHYLAYWIWLF